MKIVLISLIPLLACLLFPPLDVRAERNIPAGQRRKRDSYVLNATHSVDAYRHNNDNQVVITRIYPQNNAGKKVEVIGDIVPSVVSCKLKRALNANTIDCKKNGIAKAPKNYQKKAIDYKKRSEDEDFFGAPWSLWKICSVCKELFKVDSRGCYIGEKKEVQRCKNMVKEMPHTIDRVWNTFTVPY